MKTIAELRPEIKDGPHPDKFHEEDDIQGGIDSLKALESSLGGEWRELSDEELDNDYKFEKCTWSGGTCYYLNDHRIIGGKPWGGGSCTPIGKFSIRDLIRALKPLQQALGFDYLGHRTATPPTRPAEVPDDELIKTMANAIESDGVSETDASDFADTALTALRQKYNVTITEK